MGRAAKPAWLRLADMRAALIFIEETVATTSKDLAHETPILRLSLERALEIVSEASRFLPDDLKSRHPSIPWRRVADLGNVIRHGYDYLDWDIMWDILTLDAPHLLRELDVAIAGAGTPKDPNDDP
jgi:uncharacterized protein with HEPN domain